MAQLKKKKGPENKSSTHERIQLAAIGMEAEFAVIMDGVQVKPEDIFGSPRKITFTSTWAMCCRCHGT